MKITLLIFLAITLPSIITIVTTAIGVIFPFVWGKLKGYRTKVIAILTTVIGAMMMISDNILPWLSTNLGIDTTTITGIIVALLGLINYVLRLFTDTADASMGQFFKRTGMNKSEATIEVQKLRRIV